MTDRTLGLDLAQSTGWATVTGGRLVSAGAIALKWDAKDQLAAVHRGAVIVRRWLQVGPPPTRVAMEDVRFVVSRDAHASHWRTRTIWSMALAELDPMPELVLVDVGTLKKWATGSGKATKADMCAAASQRTGLTLVARGQPGGTKAQEDQADAILIALWAAGA